jgi:PAS domain S-box-containing protein
MQKRSQESVLEQDVATLDKLKTEYRQGIDTWRLYAFIVNAADQYMTLIDRNYVYEVANRAYCEAKGIQPADIIGRSVEEIWGRERFEGIIKGYLDQCFAGHEAHLEDWFRFNGRDLRCYEVNYYPYMNADGEVTHAVVVTNDVTTRRQAEEALRESEERFRTIFETAEDSIFIKDDNFCYTLVNPAMEQLFGFPAAKIIGKGDECLFDKAIVENIRQVEKRVLAGEVIVEEQTRKVDGRTMHFHVIKMPMCDKSGRITGIYGIARDITEMRRLQTQLQQAQKLEAIGTLAGGIAHDFNNMLSPIVGYVEMILEDLPQNSSLWTDLNHVLTAALRAKELVHQILSFSRQTDQVLKPLKAQTVIKEVLKLVRASLPATIEIDHAIQDDCGFIYADPVQIHQIAMNLVTNAYHAMPETGGRLEISLDCVALDGSASAEMNLLPGVYLRLRVADNGTGIDEGIVNRIFDPYFTTKDKDKGTGLGLSVVHGIVKNYKGHITVTRQEEGGTLFTVYLPTIDDEKGHGAALSPRQVRGGSERILLVDDEEQIARMTELMLRRLGYHVTIRTSSVEALALFRNRPRNFDLLITDMTMPNMTGDILARKVLEIHPDLPIIICTGYSEHISEKKAKALGIRAFVMKPILKDAMAMAIRRVLGD